MYSLLKKTNFLNASEDWRSPVDLVINPFFYQVFEHQMKRDHLAGVRGPCIDFLEWIKLRKFFQLFIKSFEPLRAVVCCDPRQDESFRPL